jgi:hypothetical protein
LLYGAAISISISISFLTALLASRSDQPARARSNRKEQKKSTFGQPLERANTIRVVGISYHPKEQYIPWEYQPTLIAVRDSRGKGLRGCASQSPRLYHPYNGLF